MTLCIAVRVNEYVYSIADTAMSLSSVVETPPLPPSTFGDDNRRYCDNVVLEDYVMKLIPIGDQAFISYTGSVVAVFSAIECIKEAVEAGISIEQAFRANCRIDSPNATGSLILSFVDEHGPRLFTYDSNTHEVNESSCHSQILFGSGLIPEAQELFSAHVKQLTENSIPDGDAFLACLLGYARVLVEHNSLMSTGIGGAMHGGWVNSKRRSWQPDLLYMNYYSDSPAKTWLKISTIIREDVLVVGTDIDKPRTKYLWPAFVHEPPKWFSEFHRLWWDKWRNRVTNYADYGRYDYVVYCDLMCARLMVVEMRKHRESQVLSYRVADARTMNTFHSVELNNRLYGQFDGTFAWDFLPYEPGTAASDGEPQLTEVDKLADQYFVELPSEIARLELDKVIARTESKGGEEN